MRPGARFVGSMEGELLLGRDLYRYALEDYRSWEAPRNRLRQSIPRLTGLVPEKLLTPEFLAFAKKAWPVRSFSGALLLPFG